VHCLDEDIYQIIDLYQCESPSCELSYMAFNPCPRFDYGNRTWGVDVLRYIAKYFLQIKMTTPKILKCLEFDHPNLHISEDSINRICDDLLELKSFRIDERTIDLILTQGMILLGLDGQDPGSNNDALWIFTDLLTGRILATAYFDHLSAERLHLYLEDLCAHYRVPVVGWVSDKQNVITKCHDTYYAQIPHQYCQFHFLTHLWDNLECLDSNIFIPLKEMIMHLYIHITTNKVNFEGKGIQSVKEVFKLMDEDLQTMSRMRNKTFKELRGVWLYDQLTKYAAGICDTLRKMDPILRVTKIMQNTSDKITQTLQDVTSAYKTTRELWDWFQKIRGYLNEKDWAWQEQQRCCEEVFQAIWLRAKIEIPSLTIDDCKAFLPHKTISFGKVLGEWCRLWNSYRPGLFQYYRFPGAFRTNGILERLFSLEKCALITRVGKGNVSHMIATRGEAYLRITHCDPNELAGDIFVEYRDELVKALRSQLHERIEKQTKNWRTRERSYQGFQGVQITMEPIKENMTKMEVR
jgi:hypothetical protein